MKIGQILKNLRVKNNLNQSEVAERIGVTSATYSRYESDLLEPNLDKLLEISILFKEDPSIFFRAELIKKLIIDVNTDTGYSFLFTYWNLEEIAKILNIKRNELSLPDMNKYARLLQLSFEQLSIASLKASELLKPESFEEFLKRNKLEWIIEENETFK